MIEIIQITFGVTIIAIAYQILIMPSELLQRWALFVNITFAGTPIQKLLLCPYCFGGQLALWCSLYYIYKGSDVVVLFSVPCVIVAVYFIVKSNFK